jgi:hypothetical protein
MHRHLITLLAAVALSEQVLAQDPQLTSWFTQNSGKYARVYQTTADRTNGNASTTWTNHTTASYSDIYDISHSPGYVYVKRTGLASYVMGPWLNPMGGQYANWPTTQTAIARIPRTSTLAAPPAAASKTNTPGGAAGIYVNGVAIFNAYDGQAWSGTAIVNSAPSSMHSNATYYWHRNAPVAEAFNFDDAGGHHPPNGTYHNHQNPIGLRYQLGDRVNYNSTTKAYSEGTTTPIAHSPIVGWAADGYPIYGPYGYGTATNSSSAVRRMVAGYVKRDGSNGTDNVSVATGTLPAWYARYRLNKFGGTYSTTTTQLRSSNTTTYPIGTFAQDWAYLGDLGGTQGTTFDLDEYNARYCVTPEFPSGTWAYFITLDSAGAATYPYVLGFEFVGAAAAATITTLPGGTTSHYIGGPNKAITFTGTPTASGGSVTMTWDSVEGSTYTVENSLNQSTWNTKTTGLSATTNSTTTSNTFTTIGSSGTEYARVTRTALATYDTTGVGSATVAQTGTGSYSAGSNTAPTLTTVSTLTGATKNNAFTISYATLAAAADEADAEGNTISFRIEAISSGTLSVGVNSLLSTGGSITWTPPVNVFGNGIAAFTVKAYDGSLASSTAVQVSVDVANGNSQPTLTAISTLTGATEETAFSISYATLAAAADEADLDGDTLSFRIEAISSGTLSQAAGTLLSTGQTLTWTPATNASGTIAAFTVKAYDGAIASSTAIAVNVSVANINDAPTLSTVSTLTGAVVNTAFTISYATLAAAANEADVDGDPLSFRIESISNGTLSQAVNSTLSTGGTMTWTPTAGFTGTISAFSITATDGTLSSGTPVSVNITVSTADPTLSKWYVAHSGKYARIQETDAEAQAGTTKTTWTRTTGGFTLTQATPTYAGPTQIDYSASWVYVRTGSLATYTMGPWYNNAAKSALFINVPKNQGIIIRIPRAPGSIPTTKTQINGLNIGGVQQPAGGYYVDGVAIYDPTDGFSYDNGTEAGPGTGQWHRDAYVNEGITFDYSMAHQQNTGFYHNHANPIALRYQLGDAVSYSTITKQYTETLSPTQHSPIIGWMIDGLPVYGPYGYSTATDSSSGVRRMVGGFVKRDGTTTGVDNITTAGRTLPAWMLRNNGNTAATGPTVSTTYPLGRYIQDWAYLGDLTKTGGGNYQQGVDFDLNEYNVRWCVTPEFPSGTYAYFLNITASGTPQFPYMVNRWFYGTPTGGKVNSVTETVTNQFSGGPNLPLNITNATVSSPNVTLTWDAVEGGTYSVDASSNNSTWTSKATGLTVSAANTKSNTHATLGSTGTEYARVNRTALATYDTLGVVTPVVAQTTSTSFSLGSTNTPPTLTNVDTIAGATEDTAFTISYAALAAAADEADAEGNAISFRIESVLSGTLTKGGTAVSPGSTLLSSGESLVWTPPANAYGEIGAFSVKAYDGNLASSSALAVSVHLASVNDAPTLTTFATLTGGTEDVPYSIHMSQFENAANEADVDSPSISFRIESLLSGTLTKNGVAVTPGTTTVTEGESVIWTPASNANGTLGAFTVVAWDGFLASSPAVTVNIEVTAVNDAPTMTDKTLDGGIYNTNTHTFTYSVLAFNLDEADVEGTPLSFRVESVPSGTLRKNGIQVEVGVTTVSSGESLVWTPPAATLGSMTAYTLKAFDGSLTSSGTATVQINVRTPPITYTVWAASYGLSGTSAEQDADPDNDGVPNAIEYTLGRNPTVPDVSTNPILSSLSGGYLNLSFLRYDESEEEMELRVEYSNNLTTWSSVSIVNVSSTSGGVIITVAENGTAHDSITVQIPVSLSTPTFARLSVTED